jgi:hypothetical protein
MSLQLKIILGISKKFSNKIFNWSLTSQLINQARFLSCVSFALSDTLKFARKAISIVLINSLNPWGYFCSNHYCKYSKLFAIKLPAKQS